MARRKKTKFTVEPSAIPLRSLTDSVARVSSAINLLRELSEGPRPFLSLLDLEDRRQWHPEGPKRPARALSRSASRLMPTKSYTAAIGRGVRFAVPGKVAICVRRERRREVLFARRQTRRGSGAPKRRNWFSAVSCRR